MRVSKIANLVNAPVIHNHFSGYFAYVVVIREKKRREEKRREEKRREEKRRDEKRREAPAGGDN